MDEVIIASRCAVCPSIVVHKTPVLLQASEVFCDAVCVALGRALSAGDWYDAVEITQGGRFHNRPEIWFDA